MQIDDVVAIAAAELARCYVRAEKRYKRAFAMPEVRFDLRGAGAGKAYSRFNLIRLNPALLARGNRRDVIETAAHEAAHLITHSLHAPRALRPHGSAWREVMRALGRTPQRTHSLNTEGLVRHRRRYPYTCACAADGSATHELSSVRHQRVRRGGWYSCRRCGTVLVLARREGFASLPAV